MNKSLVFKLVLITVTALTASLLSIYYYRLKIAPTQKSQSASPNEQIKTAHFVDSTPLHGEIYAAQPINVTVNFNFDLAKSTQLVVTSAEGNQFTEGDTLIEDVSTALKRKLKQNMPDGDYRVKYNACFIDGSCYDGQFLFKIDSVQKPQFQDFKGKSELIINMKDLKFKVPKVIISPGTKVTWINNDNVGHFVNTETHPEHTYFPGQNSQELINGESFSTTFTMPGQYNYHCSAHVPEGMLGSIIVEN